MDSNEAQIKQVVLQRMGRCSVCHRDFENDDLKVMARNANVWMLVVRCRDCQARLFVAALVGDGEAQAASFSLRQMVGRGPGLDIEDDIVEIEMPHPVTADDVSDMREFLSSFDGNFKRLFSE